MRLLKNIFVFVLLLYASVCAQSPAGFINYARQADKGEGDNNFTQAIHFSFDDTCSAQAYLRIFDIDCGGLNDNAYGVYDSRFEFILLRGEITEEKYDSVRNDSEFLMDNLIKKFEVGENPARDNTWMTFADFKIPGQKKYTLIVNGLGGNDANLFGVFLSPDSTENRLYGGSEIYSFEPTLRYEKAARMISLNIKPFYDTQVINVEAFDLDKAPLFLSTFLRENIRVQGDYSKEWMISAVRLQKYETGRMCSFSLNPGSKIFNDITIRFKDENGRRIPVLFPAYYQEPAKLPAIVPEINYASCSQVDISLEKPAADSGISYQWVFDDGSTAEGAEVSKNYEKPGNYSAEILAEKKSAGVTRGKVEKIKFVVNDLPVISAPDQLLAASGENIVFDASKSFDRGGRITKYVWNFGDSSTGSRAVENHRYSSPGDYIAELTVSDNFREGCNSSKKIIPVKINARPNAVAEYKQRAAAGEEISFDASESSDPDGNIISYTWDFGPFGTAEGQSVQKSFNKPGKYKFTLTVQDDSKASNNTNTAEVGVIINEKPVAETAKQKILAVDENWLFDASGSFDRDGKIISYQWNFADGGKGSGAKVTHSFSRPGVYPVVLKITDDSGTGSATDSALVNVTVNAPPVADIQNKIYSSDGHITFDASKSYDPDGNIKSYSWSFGDGSTGSGEKTIHDYKVPGEYEVILQVTDNTEAGNNRTADTSRVIIDRRPIADAGPDLTVPSGAAVKFDAKNSSDPDGKIISYRWLVDNRVISEESTAEFTFEQPKVYRVALEVTDDFPEPLSDADYAEITVNKSPFAIIDSRTAASPGEKIVFDASKSSDDDGKIINYKWRFSDNFTAEEPKTERIFKTPGRYTAILTVTDNAGTANSASEDTVVIKVNNSPVIQIQDEMLTCDNKISFDASKSFDPDGDNLSFTWEFPNSVSVKSGPVLTYDFRERGLLPVKITADDGLNLPNSRSEKTVTVKINRPPVADAGPDTTICAGELLILNAMRSYDADKDLLKFTWVFDDSTKLEGSSVFRSFRKGGVYGVKLIVTDNSGLSCASSYDTKLIRVIEAPIADAGPDLNGCANSPVKFDGSKSSDVDGIVNSFEWDFGDGEYGGGERPTHIYSKPGVYKVTLTVTGDLKGECDNTDRDEMTVTIIEAPRADFTSPDSLEVNTAAYFDASPSVSPSGKIVSWHWDFGDGTADSGRTVSHSFSKFGQYKVTLLIKNDSGGECNSSGCSKLIYVNEKPVAEAGGKITALANELVYFDGSKSADADGKVSRYLWDFGDGTRAESVRPSHAFGKSGNYVVVLTVFDDTRLKNNSDSDTLTVLVKPGLEPSFELPEFIYPGREIKISAADLSRTGLKISYVWNVNGKDAANNKYLSVKFDHPGSFPVRLTVSENSGDVLNSAEYTRYLKVIRYPEISLPDSVVICGGERLNISPEIISEAADPGIRFSWSDAEGRNAGNQKNLNVIPSSSSYFYLGLRDAEGTLFAEDSIFVRINSSPEMQALSDTTVYIGRANSAVRFDVSRAADREGDLLSIRWNFGDGSSAAISVAYHSYGQPGDYRVELTLDDGRGTSCSVVKKYMTVHVKKSE